MTRPAKTGTALKPGFKILDQIDRRSHRQHRSGRLSAKQADAILELQLYRLTQSFDRRISERTRRDPREIAEYESILASEKKLRGVIVKEIEEVKKELRRRASHPIHDESAEITLKT